MACLGLEREIQGQGSHRTLRGIHPTLSHFEVSGCSPPLRPALLCPHWLLPQNSFEPPCPGASELCRPALCSRASVRIPGALTSWVPHTQHAHTEFSPASLNLAPISGQGAPASASPAPQPPPSAELCRGPLTLPPPSAPLHSHTTSSPTWKTSPWEPFST